MGIERLVTHIRLSKREIQNVSSAKKQPNTDNKKQG
jgi:hypothetical protein